MKVEINIPDALITGALESAHQGITYWCSKASRPLTDALHHRVKLTLAEEYRSQSSCLLTRSRIVGAIGKLAVTRPLIFARLMAGNIDATGADVIVQLAVFGQEVYG